MFTWWCLQSITDPECLTYPNQLICDIGIVPSDTVVIISYWDFHEQNGDFSWSWPLSFIIFLILVLGAAEAVTRVLGWAGAGGTWYCESSD